MNTALHEVDERTNLTTNNKFELFTFRLGEAPGSNRRELFGINVFKIREIITVINLPSVVGCKPKDGPKILLVTEYKGTLPIIGFLISWLFSKII